MSARGLGASWVVLVSGGGATLAATFLAMALGFPRVALALGLTLVMGGLFWLAPRAGAAAAEAVFRTLFPEHQLPPGDAEPDRAVPPSVTADEPPAALDLDQT